MSDSIEVARCDQERCEKTGYEANDSDVNVPGTVYMTEEHADYGCLQALCDEGVPFLAYNRSNDQAVACDGKEMAEANALCENVWPVVVMLDEGSFVQEHIDAAKNYWRVLALASDALAERVKTPVGRETE